MAKVALEFCEDLALVFQVGSDQISIRYPDPTDYIGNNTRLASIPVADFLDFAKMIQAVK